MSKSNPMLSKVKGTIIGTAIGDALGAPMEMFSKEKIDSLDPDLNDFIDIENNVGSYTNHVSKKGEWTDDTQLMRPIIWSILESKAIDPYGIAKQTREIFQNEKKRGWSKSVIAAITRLSNGVSWWEAAEESLGTGSGVAMKAAPLGVYLSQNLPKELPDYMPSILGPYAVSSSLRNEINSIMLVGMITHHEVGIRAGVLQSVLVGLSINGIKNKKKILNYLANIEEAFFGDSRFVSILRAVSKLKSVEEITKTVGLGSKATESWVAAASIFLNTNKRENAYKNLVTLIKQGGDCDTTGAIFGALIGARWGTKVFPRNLVTGVESSKELLNWGSQLFSKLNMEADG